MSMTDEEIKAYTSAVEKTSIDQLQSVLPKKDTYNFDIKMTQICEALSEMVQTYRSLNRESGGHELDEEITDLLRKIYFCNDYREKGSHHEEMAERQHQLVFAKTPAGNPYFSFDLDKVPRETYGEVKKVLEEILYGSNKSDPSKVRYYTNNDLPKKVLEFKGFQVRIFTTKLRGNILCVFGLSIKKANYDKKIQDGMKHRLTTISSQIDGLKQSMYDDVKKAELIADGQQVLDDIMSVLDDRIVSEDVELLFPVGEELEAVVPFNESEEMESQLVDGTEETDLKQSDEGEQTELKPNDDEISENVETIPEAVSSDLPSVTATTPTDVVKTPKKVKRRGRGLGRKTIARNEINDSLRGLPLEDLLKIQNFILKLQTDRQQDEEIESLIGQIYEGFHGMDDDEKKEFEIEMGNEIIKNRNKRI